MAAPTTVKSPSQPSPTAAHRASAPSDSTAMIDALERLQREFEVLRVREEAQLAALHRLQEQIQNAATVQRDLRPTELPETKGLEIGVYCRSAEAIGGDAYDTFRLDDHRVAFVLSDATGHGVSAALLSSYVQRGLRGAGTNRPDEVLRDVNADLLGRELSECQFVAALYAIYDEQVGILRWARGGVPYPVLVRPGEKPRLLVSEGPLVGACDTPRFEVKELRLEAGDTVLLYSDGMEGLWASPSADDAAQEFRESAWMAALAQGRLSHAVASLRKRVEELAATGADLDDVTLLALRRSG